MSSLLIVNPRASNVTEAAVERVGTVLGGPETVWTESPGHATELVRSAAAAERIYVFSGDGGFNEALNGSDGRVPLGFVPGGGTSVLPRALGLPRDPVAAARHLVRAEPRRISLGRVNGRRFAFAAGIGLDAEILRRAGRTPGGRRRGDLGTALAAVRILVERRFRFEPVLEIRGRGRAAFVLVANGDPYTYVGPFGLRVARGARFEDGLALVAPRRLGVRHYPGVALYLATGRGLPLFAARDADRIVVACDAPTPLQADGEDLGDVTEAVFEAERDAIAVLA